MREKQDTFILHLLVKIIKMLVLESPIYTSFILLVVLMYFLILSGSFIASSVESKTSCLCF